MRAVTFQAPGVVSVEERPEPELIDPDDAIVRIDATGVCGSDLHIYHGRVQIEPGFTIGHEYVGTVVAAGDAVTRVAVGDRVLGCFQTACGECFFCLPGIYHRCEHSRTFGHGATLGSLQGTQADMALVPHANLVLRRVPEGISDDVALFAGDVMGTGFHAVEDSGMRARRRRRRARARPGRAVRRAGRARPRRGARVRDRQVAERLSMAESFGAEPLHLVEQDVRAAVREATEGRGVDVCDRRRRRPQGAGERHSPDAQLRRDPVHRRLRRARRGAHGPAVAEGADAARRPGQRDRRTSTACCRCCPPACSTPARWSRAT